MSKSYIFDLLKTGRVLYKSQGKGWFVFVQHLAVLARCQQWYWFPGNRWASFLYVYNMGSLKSMKFRPFLRMVHETIVMRIFPINSTMKNIK